jgi:hypothetical protein
MEDHVDIRLEIVNEILIITSECIQGVIWLDPDFFWPWTHGHISKDVKGVRTNY